MSEHKDFYQLEKKIIRNRDLIDRLLEKEDPKDKKEIARLKKGIEEEWNRISRNLTPLQIVQIARHPRRPYTLDYIEYLTDDFLEFHGDRRAGDDKGERCRCLSHSSISMGSNLMHRLPSS